MDLNKSVVRSNGKIDVAATLSAVEAACIAENDRAESAFASVAGAVAAVFAEHPSAAINTPAVCSLAMQKLGTPPGEFTATQALIQDYLKSESGEGGLFLVKKGKGGGVSLRQPAGE